MPDQPQTATFDIIPPEVVLPPEDKLSLEQSFGSFFQQAQQMREQCASITDPIPARAARLALKKLRGEAEKKRVDLKKNIVLMGKAIDGANNLLLGIITPIETAMDEIEKAEIRREEQRIADLHESRYSQIEPYRIESFMKVDFGTMPEEEFNKMLADAKELAQARIDREKREAEDKARREKEEADERERVRLENLRLQKEADDRKEELRKEREKADLERRALEEQARLQKEEADRVLREQQAENQRRIDAERALADAERMKREKAEAEVAAEKKRQEDEQRQQREAEQQRLADIAAAKDAAEKAPDREKLTALAMLLHATCFPIMSTPKGKSELDLIKVRFGQLEQWIRDKAKNL